MTIVVVFAAAHVMGFLTALRALMSVRASQGAIAWLISLNVVPLVAVPAYWIFGRSKFRGYILLRQVEDEEVRELVNALREGTKPFLAAPEGDQTRVLATERLAQMPFLGSNGVDLLIDGHETLRVRRTNPLSWGRRPVLDGMKRLAPSHVVAQSAPQAFHAVTPQWRRRAMEHIGIDVHKNQSQICILTSDGELIEKRIQTNRERLQTVLGQREQAQILIESATESEWVARCVESLGHEVIVADPNFAPMYARRSRKVKTDSIPVVWLR